MPRVAAYDCGTNSLRLLVADLDVRSQVSTDVYRRTEIVRLGQDVDRTGVFAPEALERTFAVVEEYAALVKDANVDAQRFVATSAARDVANRDEFVDGIRSRLGIEPEVVSGDEEARLSYDGATRGVDAGDGRPRPWFVLDIGGGSTELVRRAGDSGPVQGQSLDVGSVRLTERHLHSDPPSAAQIAAARADVSHALESLRLDLSEVGTLVGVAGSITTIAAMAMGLEAYDRQRTHHAWIDNVAVQAACEALLAMTVAERRGLAFMAPGRADVIGGGCIVLETVMARVRTAGLLVSEHDILDGIAWSAA